MDDVDTDRNMDEETKPGITFLTDFYGEKCVNSAIAPEEDVEPERHNDLWIPHVALRPPE